MNLFDTEENADAAYCWPAASIRNTGRSLMAYRIVMGLPWLSTSSPTARRKTSWRSAGRES